MRDILRRFKFESRNPPPSMPAAFIARQIMIIRHWIPLHGFALNIHGPLASFDAITPCGIANVEITSLEAEGCPGLSVAQAAEDIQPHLHEALAELKSA